MRARCLIRVGCCLSILCVCHHYMKRVLCMGRAKRACFASVMLLCVALLFSGTAFADESRQAKSLADVVAKIVPAVVNISGTQKAKKQAGNVQSFSDILLDENLKFFLRIPQESRPPTQRKTYSLGSGFIISPDGYIVTNYHVIYEADEVNVTFSNESVYKARVIGKDMWTDVALLKIDLKDKTSLPFLSFADSDKIRVGDTVVVVGNPFGLGGTVTSGIISAKGRYIKPNGHGDFLQTDAPINSGNSGGPVCDIDGRVVGVSSAIISPSGGNVGIGFASTSNMVTQVIKQLKDKGTIERGWLGVTLQGVDANIADGLGLSEVRGAIVVAVSQDSPAMKAGIRHGDVILRFNSVDVRDTNHLIKLVSETPPHRKVRISVLRDSKNVELTATIMKSEDSDFEEEGGSARVEGKSGTVKSDFLGITVASLDPDIRRNFDIDPDMTGVVVVEIKQDAPAALSDISQGDVIKSVNQKEVKNMEDFKTAVRSIKDEKRKTVLLFVVRPGVGAAFIGFNTNIGKDER